MPFGALQLVRQTYRTPEIKKPTIASWVLRRSCGEGGSLKRNRTLTQLAEIQRNTCVFEYLDHAGRRNLMKLPVPQIVPQPFLGYGFFEVLAPLGFRESFARLRRIA